LFWSRSIVNLTKHVLDHFQAQRKTEIEPNRMGDDLDRKAVAAVEWVAVYDDPSSDIGIHASLS
jgi:TRAP-type mannitol/chloroaromatic compound transport system substrate-binding protein